MLAQLSILTIALIGLACLFYFKVAEVELNKETVLSRLSSKYDPKVLKVEGIIVHWFRMVNWRYLLLGFWHLFTFLGRLSRNLWQALTPFFLKLEEKLKSKKKRLENGRAPSVFLKGVSEHRNSLPNRGGENGK